MRGWNFSSMKVTGHDHDYHDDDQGAAHLHRGVEEPVARVFGIPGHKSEARQSHRRLKRDRDLVTRLLVCVVS